MTLTATDLFCGAGGSSIGAEAAGVTLRMAANHWALAVETHNTNFPHADHDCADVSQVDPRRYPTTDILLASPECTNHSQAKSKRPEPNLFDPAAGADEERSRATMWDVVRFTERHRYAAVIVENVVEARKWPPFTAWLMAMESLGYEHQIAYINSMVAWPTPQSRDRMYVVFTRQGVRPDLDLAPPCWCPTCETTVEGYQAWKRPERPHGKYRSQYLYRCRTCRQPAAPFAYPAATAIDWTLPCPRIGDRTRPLAPATRRRIEVGLRRWGPTIVQAAGHTFERPGYHRAWPAFTAPIPVQTTTLTHGVAMPAFFVKNNGSVAEAKYRAHPITNPLGALTIEPTQALVEMPFIAELRGGGSDARAVSEPLATVCASGNHHGLVVPVHHGANGPAARPTSDPWPTQTGRQELALVMKNYGDGTDPSMTKPADTHPFGAVTTQDHHSLVVPFLTAYYGTGGASPVTEPVGTQTTRDRHALVDPAIEVDDCGFRMLEPHEAGAAMAFPSSYVVLGSKRQKVRLYGNAVTPPVMQILVERVTAALEGR